MTDFIHFIFAMGTYLIFMMMVFAVAAVIFVGPLYLGFAVFADLPQWLQGWVQALVFVVVGFIGFVGLFGGGTRGGNF
jgi:hypothetical protein